MITHNNKESQKMQFCFSPQPIEFNIVIITGVCRSGKTLAARLIGSMSNVEYVDEPWLQETLPLMPYLGYMERTAARHTMMASTFELMNDIILYRQGNFRPSDLSTVWNVKEPAEIFHRLVELQSRDDVKGYVAAHNSTLVLVAADTVPFIDFFYEAFPACKVIHVVRDGFAVAADIESKQWYTTQTLRSPGGNVPYRLFQAAAPAETFYIPWWVRPGDEARFLQTSAYEQGLYYWQRILEINKQERREIQQAQADQFLTVRYEDIVGAADDTVSLLARFVDTAATARTAALQRELRVPAVQERAQARLAPSAPCDRNVLNDILTEFNYPAIESQAYGK